MNVQPSTSFEAVAKFPTGLAGTLGLRIIDNAGNTTLARFTASISEYPAGSGVYQVTLTSPGTPGQYTLVWDDGSDHWAIDDLLVTTETALTELGSGHLYVTRDDLKAMLLMTGTEYANSAIDTAVQAAARAIDAYKDTRFYPTTETRLYTPEYADVIDFDGGGLNTLTSVKVDTDGDGVFDTTWEVGTDFVLEPANAKADGVPYTRLRLLPQADRKFPNYLQSVQVVGSFGWAAAPSQVTQAAVLLANRLLDRTREAPLGILVQVAGELVATARLGRIDPDVAFLLDQLPGGARDFASLQLS